MQQLSKFLVPGCVLAASTLGYAMEEETKVIESNHWSTVEFQSPLRLKTLKVLNDATDESQIYHFQNLTPYNLRLSFNYDFTASNNPNETFDKDKWAPFDKSFAGSTSGWLKKGIHLEANSSSSPILLRDWVDLEKNVEKMFKTRFAKDYQGAPSFKFALTIKVSKLVDEMSCLDPSIDFLTLSTAQSSFEYKYVNPFYSVFVISNHPTIDYNRIWSYSIENHVISHSK